MFYGFFAFHTPAQTGADKFFGKPGTSVATATLFLFVSCKYFYGFFAFHTPAQIGAD